ncbi:hypothetical protein HDU76_012778 [Blyttiomyces sp. JEL0837]|nr:hypothetical protein HDU76_012778 [Blyttiomyces sp. JEL0837]
MDDFSSISAAKAADDERSPDAGLSLNAEGRVDQFYFQREEQRDQLFVSELQHHRHSNRVSSPEDQAAASSVSNEDSVGDGPWSDASNDHPYDAHNQRRSSRISQHGIFTMSPSLQASTKEIDDIEASAMINGLEVDTDDLRIPSDLYDQLYTNGKGSGDNDNENHGSSHAVNTKVPSSSSSMRSMSPETPSSISESLARLSTVSPSLYSFGNDAHGINRTSSISDSSTGGVGVFGRIGRKLSSRQLMGDSAGERNIASKSASGLTTGGGSDTVALLDLIGTGNSNVTSRPSSSLSISSVNAAEFFPSPKTLSGDGNGANGKPFYHSLPRNNGNATASGGTRSMISPVDINVMLPPPFPHFAERKASATWGESGGISGGGNTAGPTLSSSVASSISSSYGTPHGYNGQQQHRMSFTESNDFGAVSARGSNSSTLQGYRAVNPSQPQPQPQQQSPYHSHHVSDPSPSGFSHVSTSSSGSTFVNSNASDAGGNGSASGRFSISDPSPKISGLMKPFSLEALSPLSFPNVDGSKNIWGAPDINVGVPVIPVSSSVGSTVGAGGAGADAGNAGNRVSWGGVQPQSQGQVGQNNGNNTSGSAHRMSLSEGKAMMNSNTAWDQAAARLVPSSLFKGNINGGNGGNGVGTLMEIPSFHTDPTADLYRMDMFDEIGESQLRRPSGGISGNGTRLRSDQGYNDPGLTSMGMNLQSPAGAFGLKSPHNAFTVTQLDRSPYALYPSAGFYGNQLHQHHQQQQQQQQHQQHQQQQQQQQQLQLQYQALKAMQARNAFMSAGGTGQPPFPLRTPSGYTPSSATGYEMDPILMDAASLIGFSPSLSPVKQTGTGGLTSTANSTNNSTEDADLPIVREIQTSKLRVDEKKLTKDYFDQLTREALELCVEICPSPEERMKQEMVFEGVLEISKRVFPDAQLHHFGSTANGFSLAGADMDLYVSTSESTKLSTAQCVEKLGHMLKQAGMKDVKMLTRARVPIVKMRDPITGVRCDIGFHNNLAMYNTRLLKTYAQIDHRFRELVFVVKYWSKRRNINEPYFGTLSSYCYVLMIIHLLQIRGVLPCLQRILPDGTAAIPAPVHPSQHRHLQNQPGVPPVIEVEGNDIYFYDNLKELPKHWTCTNQESLGELLVAFFKYYSAEFPYVHGVASVRAGRVLSKEEKGWTKERQQEINRNGSVKDRFWLCVEDPFEVSHNIGRPVDKETLYDVRGEFIRASKFLCAGASDENVLAKVCERAPPSSSKKSPQNALGGGNIAMGSMNMGMMQDPTLDRSFRGHKDVITDLSFKPSMTQLASGSMDHSVMVWNFKPQLRAYRFVGHKGPVTSVHFSPSGTLLASASRDKTVRLWTPNIWSTHRTKFQYTLAGHLNWVRTARFSPDSRVIVSGSDDKTVKLWDLGSKTCVKTYWDHVGMITSVAFHPGGTVIATASTDKSIKLFDIRTHKLIQHYGDAHSGSVSSHTSATEAAWTGGGPNSISFGGPGGEWLLSTGMDGVVKIWDLKEGHLFYTLHGHKHGPTTAGTFSPDGDFFATGGSDAQVMVWRSNFDVGMRLDEYDADAEHIARRRASPHSFSAHPHAAHPIHTEPSIAASFVSRKNASTVLPDKSKAGGPKSERQRTDSPVIVDVGASLMAERAEEQHIGDVENEDPKAYTTATEVRNVPDQDRLTMNEDRVGEMGKILNEILAKLNEKSRSGSAQPVPPAGMSNPNNRNQQAPVSSGNYSRPTSTNPMPDIFNVSTGTDASVGSRPLYAQYASGMAGAKPREANRSPTNVQAETGVGAGVGNTGQTSKGKDPAGYVQPQQHSFRDELPSSGLERMDMNFDQAGIAMGGTGEGGVSGGSAFTAGVGVGVGESSGSGVGPSGGDFRIPSWRDQNM